MEGSPRLEGGGSPCWAQRAGRKSLRLVVSSRTRVGVLSVIVGERGSEVLSKEML